MKRGLLYSALAVPLGIFIFVYGGYDDSPGAQLIGAIVVMFGITAFIKSRKQPSDVKKYEQRD